VSKPAWAGKVVAILINADGSAATVQACIDKTTIPILQDASGAPMWKGLGISSGSFLLVDAAGIVAAEWQGTFESLGPQIEAAIDAVVGP